MAKKGFMVVAIITLLILGGCLSTPTSAPMEKQIYPDGIELYPAIYGAFSELYPNSIFTEIDFYNNSYTVFGLNTRAAIGITELMHDMKISLNQNNEFNTSYSRVYQRDDMRWVPSDYSIRSQFINAVNNVTSRIVTIANNPAEFEKHSKAAMSDIKFVYAIIGNLTDLAFDEFIKNFVAGSEFNIKGTILEVGSNNRTIYGKSYKYVVSLTQELIGNDLLYCRFFTNQDNVIRLNKGTELSIKGTLTGASKGNVIGANLYLDLVEIE